MKDLKNLSDYELSSLLDKVKAEVTKRTIKKIL